MTAAQALLDLVAAGARPDPGELAAITPLQWGIYYDELAPLCPSAVAPHPVRQRNALRIEVLPDSGPRCTRRSPDGRGLAWLLSGGDPLAYGACCAHACPRARKASGPAQDR